MLVLLPPSETKAAGGDGGPLDLDELSFPALNPTRQQLADELVKLAADAPASRTALELSERQTGEVARNAELWISPTLPALARYTGVLYDALSVATMSGAEFGQARQRLAVSSALFGLVRGGDPIPAYRLSAGSRLPGVGALHAWWRPQLEPVLADPNGMVVDLRSGAYAALARVPAAVTVLVTGRTTGGDGRRRRIPITHHNKAYKGRLARALAVSRREPDTLDALIEIADAAGLLLERTGDRSVDLIVDG